MCMNSTVIDVISRCRHRYFIEKKGTKVIVLVCGGYESNKIEIGGNRGRKSLFRGTGVIDCFHIPSQMHDFDAFESKSPHTRLNYVTVNGVVQFSINFVQKLDHPSFYDQGYVQP